MKIGICLPHYGRAMEPAGMRRFAESAESLGFDSLWVTDHIIIPRERDMLYKENMLEPLATLSYLAGVTSRITIGTSVIVLPYRHPVLVAKAIATADNLSGGRVIFGAGVGGVEGEFIALGANFAERGAVADEYLGVIRSLWTDPGRDYEGKYVSIRGMFFSPAPIQKPHPPVWIGGSTKLAGRRAVDYGDAWHATNVTPQQFQEIGAYIRTLSVRRGRAQPPSMNIRLSVYFDVPLSAVMPPGRIALGGDDIAVVNGAKAYIASGADHIVFGLPDVTFAESMVQMERLATKVAPELR